MFYEFSDALGGAWGSSALFGHLCYFQLLDSLWMLESGEGKSLGEVQGGNCDDSGGFLDCSVKATFRV